MPVDMQDLDKKDAIAEKQRESMMVGLSKTKTELGSLQDALAKTQVELEKTNFELHAKKSKHMSPVLVLPQRIPGAHPKDNMALGVLFLLLALPKPVARS